MSAKLEMWQDQKFGIIIHWGLYAVPGIIESWNLCSENWIERESSLSYDEYKKWYWGLINDFKPVNFNPETWAKIAKEARMPCDEIYLRCISQAKPHDRRLFFQV